MITQSIRGWAPEPVEVADTITAGPVAALAGLFDQPVPAGAELPPLWHWLFFTDRPAQHELGPDGHPLEGAFMPPIPDRRRMYAGGRWTCHTPLRLGDTITRRSALLKVVPKSGRIGELLFTTVRHEFLLAGELMGVEEQDIVYRSGEPPPPSPAATVTPTASAPAVSLPTASAPTASGLAASVPTVSVPAASVPAVPPEYGPWRIDLTADPVLLFRFSALTYNAHRIHYDAEYATAVEGHPGLVVQGPLLALLLAELPRRAGYRVGSLDFRLRAPIHAGQPFTATGGPTGDLRIIAPNNLIAATMTVPALQHPR